MSTTSTTIADTLQKTVAQAVMCVLPRPLAEIVAEFAVHIVRTGLAFMGHVDAGKSTLVGHLLELLGYVSQQKMNDLSRLASDLWKGSFKYAFLMDKTRCERERGITIEGSSVSMDSPSGCKYDLIDLPGHYDFISNAIRGAALADVLVAVVAVGPGEFEASFTASQQWGWIGGLRTAIQVGICQGLDNLVVVCNKMDAIFYKQDRFLEVKEQMETFLRGICYKFATINFVPVSAWHGDNLVSPSTKMPWYQGPYLLEVFDNLQAVKMHKHYPGPLRAIGSRLGNFNKIHLVAAKVLAGTVFPGDELTIVQRGGRRDRIDHHSFLPPTAALPPLGFGATGFQPTVLGLHVAETPAIMAGQGDLVAFNLSISSPKALIGGGLVIGPRNDPPLLSVRMIANLLITRESFTKGGIGKYAPIMHINVFETEARWQRLIAIKAPVSSRGPSTSTAAPTNTAAPTSTVTTTDTAATTNTAVAPNSISTDEVKRGMVVTVEVVMLRGVYIAPHVPNRCLFRDGRSIVALGNILAYQVVRGDTTEWREKDGNVISNLDEWETRLPFVKVNNVTKVASKKKNNISPTKLGFK